MANVQKFCPSNILSVFVGIVMGGPIEVILKCNLQCIINNY